MRYEIILAPEAIEDLHNWFDYRLENDPRFLKRIEAARESLRLGRGVRIEDVEEQGQIAA